MLGMNVEVMAADVDEESVIASSPSELVEQLAKKKAYKIFELVNAEDIPIIGADTVVEINGKIIGKPKCIEDAKEMLLSFSEKHHFVHTGISVVYNGIVQTSCVTSSIHFRKLSVDEINKYVSTGEPMDKAGGYGIQGKAGAFIDCINGDFYAVVGLPICKLVTMLEDITKQPISVFMK